MDKEITELFAGLPEDVQAKLQGVTSTNEVVQILSDNAIPLPDELMEAVAGGIEDGGWDCQVWSSDDDDDYGDCREDMDLAQARAEFVSGEDLGF